jgi:hypothetical protein
MEYFQFILDFVLHIDDQLPLLIEQYGTWIYAILFFLIFLETGFVVTPFLPGDSLLFVAGTLATVSTNHMNIHFAGSYANYCSRFWEMRPTTL